MLNKIIVKLNIVMFVIMAILCINTVSNAEFSPEVTVNNDLAARILTSTRYNNWQDGTMISYEKLATDPGIWCRQHGVFLTSEYSPSRPNKDATLEVNGTSRVIKELLASNMELGITRGDAYSTNPYGRDGSKYADVYTLGKYSVESEVESRAADVWLDVHSREYEKSTSNYPNLLQSARWGVLENKANVVNRSDVESSNSNIVRNGNYSNEMQKAGLQLEETIRKTEEFLSSHSNASSQNITDYSKLKTEYNKNTKKILVGPFKIDYVFSMYHPKTTINSKALNENGDIEFAVINDIKFYADDALTREIKNYQFRFPNRDKDKQDYIKTDDRESIKYKFPLPNEEFYIEFSDEEYKDVNALARINVSTKHMEAKGRHQNLVGTAEHIAYNAKTVAIPCTNTSRIPYTNKCALHPNHNVGDGHARAYTYSITAEVLERIITQPTYHILEASLPIKQRTVVTELGTPALSTWSPIIPVPVSSGYARGNEYVPVPVLPDEPDPNWPVEPTPTPVVPTPTPTPTPVVPTPTPTPDNPTPTPTPTPEEPNPEIKLTFDIAGTVWLDSLTGKETLANGVMDEDEARMQNVIVKLYKDGEANPIRECLTNEKGEYLFQFVRVGYDYYVEFTYDGMTYTTTKYLGSQSTALGVGDTSAINAQYKANPENYLKNSHAVEDYSERLAFNSKFQVISNDKATGTAGDIPLTYRTYMSEQGAVSALITTDSNYVVANHFKMKASTKTAGLIYPLDDNYIASDSDLNLTQIGDEYYYHATYPATLNINLGLVKRTKVDFAVKNDLAQIHIFKEEGMHHYESNGKSTSALTYDASTRNSAYYTGDVFVQKIDKANYDTKLDIKDNKGTQDTRNEIDAYIEYKFIIRNQSALQLGKVLELTDHFDSDLEYATSYDEFDVTSWIETNMIDGSKEVYKEPITWEYVSDGNGYTTYKTTGIENKVLISGETIEVHLILKVKEDANRNLFMDLDENDFKDNVLEISKYTFNEGMIDKDSNPGNVKLNDYNTYEDDTDIAPHIKFVFTGNPENMQEDEVSRQGQVISGTVWEDLVDQIMPNNLYTGNGRIDVNEKGIPNVKVELLKVYENKFERVVAETRTDENGKYKFTNLDSGMYKVKYTIGDETQLSKDITYNGQDYKVVTTDTLTQYFKDPSMEVMILADTSEGMLKKGVQDILGVSMKNLIESLYDKVQKVKIGAVLFSEPQNGEEKTIGLTTKPYYKNDLLPIFDNITPNMGTSLENAINSSITKYSAEAATKVMIICTDGYISSNVKDALKKADENGIKVISIVDSTDRWPVEMFGTEESPTAGKLYRIEKTTLSHYITKIALEDTLECISDTLPNILQAKEVEKEYTDILEGSNVGDIHTRQSNIDYTDSLIYANGSIVNGDKTTNRTEFANNTQITAITPVINVMVEHNNADTANVNLGLIERPRTELQIKEEIAGIQVKLANGEVIIDTEKDMTKNVQILDGARDNIFMDKEIMQGATLGVKYRITVFNNGHVDTLGEYKWYDMFAADGEMAKEYNKALPTSVGTLYSYYTNLTFSEETNSNMAIEKNAVVTDIQTAGTSLSNWKSYIKENGTRKDKMKNDGVQTPEVKDVVVLSSEDGKTQFMREKVEWKNSSSVKTNVEEDTRIKNGSVKIAETKSLANVQLYPVISNEVINGNEVASVSTYIEYSKTLSTNDETDTMTYKQSVEIVERLNEVGRRDYEAVPGNYVPHADITEYDSAKVEDIYILPPFGEDMQNYFVYAIGATALLGVGVIFIRRKIVE